MIVMECKDPAFNEAPIRESGKSRLAVPLDGRVVAFNEAPIRESGKCARDATAYLAHSALQ